MQLGPGSRIDPYSRGAAGRVTVAARPLASEVEPCPASCPCRSDAHPELADAFDVQKALAGLNTPISFRAVRESDSFLEADTTRLAEVVRKMGKTE